MNWLEKLRSPFPFYLNDDRKNVLFVLAVSLFVVFFISFYHPHYNFHLDLTIGQKFIFGGITFIVLFFDILIMPRLFPGTFDPLNWTVGKYLLLTLWHCFVIGIFTTIVDKLYICPEKALSEIIPGAYTQVALTGIIPITIIFLFLKNTMLRENLKDALHANQELGKIKNLKKENVVKNNTNAPLTIYSETSETFSLHLPDLLYIEADDNYSTVVWKNGEGIQKKLLRANLKSIESQIDNSFAIRCHRSYIVNINAIGNITGNTNGYKLQILDTDQFIPVSRPKGKDVIEKIRQLRNVMELA